MKTDKLKKNKNAIREFLDETTESGGKVGADVTINRDYQRVRIQVYPCFFEMTPEDQRGALLHELCHSFADRLQSITENLIAGRIETKVSLQQAVEETTSRITAILSGLLAGQYKYARVGYANYLKNVAPKKSTPKKKR